MKIIHNLIVFLTLFMSISSFAMDCSICLDPISIERPNISMCPNKVCAQANPTCKECVFAWLKKSHKCPCACGSNLIMTSSVSSRPLLSRDQKIFALGASFVAVLPWIAHYWSQYRLQSTLQTINSSAHIKTDLLLGFEFDCDDGTAFLGLQESFDINQIFSALKTEQQRITLKAAIEEYDIALCNAYECIIRAYYYQSAINFEQKEPGLVHKLKECTEKINDLVIDYTRELGNPLSNMFFGIGLGALSGIGILHSIKS